MRARAILPPTTAALARAVPGVHYVGDLRSGASWSKVGRELLRALVSAGWPVTLDQHRDDCHFTRVALPPALRHCGTAQAEGAPSLTFCSPGEYLAHADRGPRVGMLVYEATHVPPAWISLARRHLEHVVVPSSFCRRAFLASGLAEDVVTIVPHGIDPAVFHPADRAAPGAAEPLTVLFVGTPVKRKGLDVLLSAWQRAFRPGDGVRLVLKVRRYPDAAHRPYVDHAWEGRVRQLQADGYAIRIDARARSEAGMARLYRQADLLCLPGRGEGFGLPLLEAMACGTPVLATGWSGPLDFVPESGGILLPGFSLVPGREMLVDWPSPPPGAKMAEPAVDGVAEALVSLQGDRARLARMGAAAARHARDWTWDAAAATLAAVLASVADRAAHGRRGAHGMAD